MEHPAVQKNWFQKKSMHVRSDKEILSDTITM
jgi:hypothetical protein